MKDTERNIYETAAKKDGINDFEFTERSETNKLVKAARREEFDFADRQWKILLSPSDFHYQLWHARVVLFGSLLLTALLAFYMVKKILYTADIEQRVKVQIQTNQQLKNEIRERKTAEVQRDKTILNLQQALDEVKTLQGILPLCSFCKKIRDDKGYWEQVDIYIHKHSQADISHSICPDCIKKHYPYLDI